ncbi:MAG: hypothetical protein D8M57_08145 [Candidatus Scalindua sp. AMX11]|nr:MAG: hypothetical protein DWQ00_11745 [Candidatus Scalindua sp.]NOG85340.1 hypothetical protein [Planctomycetota bacterium]RZV81445.1 MAG: hypothetical protein EX341_10000 [Candidatus Scalindua sp. SCAELEC01]TDE65482.1 MAG: hypothetical protein D8M57_08145 [Candidatus Scalindua sp. AMX11]GJQ59407.1 MAG: hypothetical protein SCALA701_22080 [Candidatus Scalindua sp.]
MSKHIRRIAILSLLVLALPGTSSAKSELPTGYKLLYCSALWEVMTSYDDDDGMFHRIATQEASRLEGLSRMSLLSEGVSFSEQEINAQKEEIYDGLRLYHESGDFERLIDSYYLSSAWSDKIIAYLISNRGKELERAVLAEDVTSVKKIFQTDLAEPSDDEIKDYSRDFQEAEFFVKVAFKQWAELGYGTPSRISKELRDRLR